MPTGYSEQERGLHLWLAAADTAIGDRTSSPSSGGVVATVSGRLLGTDENVAVSHLPGGQPALEPQVERSRAVRRKQREATKQQRGVAVQELQQLRAWKQARAHTGGSGEGSPNKVAGRGNSTKKGKSYLHSKTRDCKEICFSWNDRLGTCADVASGKLCPSGRVHVCQKCLSDGHRSAECP